MNVVAPSCMRFDVGSDIYLLFLGDRHSTATVANIIHLLLPGLFINPSSTDLIRRRPATTAARREDEWADMMATPSTVTEHEPLRSFRCWALDVTCFNTLSINGLSVLNDGGSSAGNRLSF